MKVKSFLISLLLVFGGMFGTLGVTLPSFSAGAVSVDASRWDGAYATSANQNDTDIQGFDSAGNEVDITSSSVKTIRIHTARGFSYFATQVNNGKAFANMTIVLESDINLAGHEWKPMGYNATRTNYFSGTFDGNHKTIYNLHNPSSSPVFGLFARVDGTIKNLNLAETNIDFSGRIASTQYIGAVVGELNGGTIDNVSVRGQVTSNLYGADAYVGGLVGYAHDNYDNSRTAVIKNSGNFAKVSAVQTVGGLVGSVNGDVEISTSFNVGEIANNQNTNAGAIYVGGLVGRVRVTLEKYLSLINSFNNGEIHLFASTNNVNVKAGGLIGQADTVKSGSANINCYNIRFAYNAGDFYLNGYQSGSGRDVFVAGLIGYAGGPTPVYTIASDGYLINNSFNVGDLVSLDGSTEIDDIGDDLFFREFLGSNISSNVASSISQNTVFYDYDAPYQIFYTDTVDSNGNFVAYNDLTNLTRVAHLDGKVTSYEFLSSTPSKSERVYGMGFTFKNEDGCWLIDESVNNGLPYLDINFDNGNSNWDATEGENWQGEGSLTSPYLVYTAEDLARIADRYNAGDYSQTSVTYFSLQNDIDLSSKAWEPIGVNNYSFKNAVFDGNGHTISGINCSIQVDYAQSIGLFGTIENAVVRNVIIEDFHFVGDVNYDIHRATLVGNVVKSYVINCKDNTNYTHDDLNGYDVYTIANASSSYLIYGENNISGASYTSGMENLSSQANLSLDKGVEAELDTDGGTVYDDVVDTETRAIKTHFGDGKFVLVDGEILSLLIDEQSNLYDETYLSKLPVDTLEAQNDNGDNYYIVKEGYKISSYTHNSLPFESVDESNNLSLITDGITAVWEKEDDVKFEVYYNSYETYYSTQKNPNYDGGNYVGIGEHRSVPVTLPYNTFNSLAGLREEIENTISVLDREGFIVEGVYDEYAEGVYSGDNILTAESNTGLFFNTDNDYYLKWQGTDRNNYSFTINFADTAINSTGYTDRYNWDEAVEKVKVTYITQKANETISEVETILEKTGADIYEDKLVFDYSTSMMDEYFEAIKIDITLKLGFSFDIANYKDSFEGLSNFKFNGKVENPSYAGYVDTYGSAFKIWPSFIYDWNETAITVGEVASYTFGQAIGNGQLDIEIARTSNQFDLELGESVSSGLAVPNAVLNSGNVSVLVEENGEAKFVNLSEYNLDFTTKIGNQSFNFALNMFDNTMISSSNEFDKFDVPVEGDVLKYLHLIRGASSSPDTNYNAFIVRLYFPEREEDERYEYYLYEFGEVANEEATKEVQTLYLIEESLARSGEESLYRRIGDFSFKILDRVASIERNKDAEPNETGRYEYVVNFFTNQMFGLVFSTESDAYYMIEYAGKRDETFTVLRPLENVTDQNLQKIYYDFTKAQDDGENFYSVSVYLGALNGQEELISVDSKRITAKVDIQFVDENGKIIEGTEEKPLPTIFFSLNEGDEAVQNVEKWTTYKEGSQITISPLTSKSMTLRIVNTEFYQWTYRATELVDTALKFSKFDKTDGNRFIDDVGGEKLSYQLYLNLIDENGEMFDADNEAYLYEDIVVNEVAGGTLKEYFDVYAPTEASEDVLGVTGLIYKGEKTAFDFNLYYNEARITSETGSKTLRHLPEAYDFTLTFVLKEAGYKVDIETKYRQTASSPLYDDESTENGTLWVLGEDEKSTSINLEVDDGFGVGLSEDAVARMSNSNSSGYSFAGFTIKTGEEGAEISEYISNSEEVTYSSMLSFLAGDGGRGYSEYLEYDSATDRYSIDLQAIFISNTVLFEASGSGDPNNITDGRTIIENYNGTEVLRYMPQGVYEATGLKNGTYYFGNTAEGNDDVLGNNDFAFEMNEYYSNRYNFTGVALLSDEAYVSPSANYDESLFLTKFSATDFAEQITIETGINKITVDGDLIKAYFKENIGALNGKKVYVVPMVTQKTLIVSLTSGANENEIVYDLLGNDVTNKEVKLKFYYNTATNIEFSKEYLKQKEDELESYYLVSDEDSVILNEYFSRKKGYTANGWLVYNADKTESSPTYIGYYRLDENFFTNEYAGESGEGDFHAYFARNYSPNTYYINYSSADELVEGSYVFGRATGATASTICAYDSEVTIAENGFTLTGYHFGGWNTKADGTGDSYGAGDVVSHNFCTGDNGDTSITLYAQWLAKKYDVEVILNSGSVSGVEGESFVIEDVTYNTKIEELNSYTAENVTRDGFIFDGFYTLASTGIKSDYYKVDGETVLNSAVFGFNDVEGEIAVTIYATWVFNGEYTMEIADNSKEYVYTGAEISSPITDYTFSGTNLAFKTDEGFTVTSLYGDVDVHYDFTSESGLIFDGTNIILPSLNVGAYYAYLTLTMEDVSEFYPTGDVMTVTGEFVFVLTPADISYSMASDYSLYYENIKYLVSLVESEEVIATFNGYGSFTNMVNSLRTDGVISPSATFVNAYEFLFMKYFNMANTRVNSYSYTINDELVEYDGYNEFMAYRNWTYTDYLSFYDQTVYYSAEGIDGDDRFDIENEDEVLGFSEERLTRASVLKNLFLLSYDVNNKISSKVLYGDDGASIYNPSQFTLTSETAVNVNSDVYISGIEVVSPMEMRANGSYEVRAYLKVADGAVAENYNLTAITVNGEERYYVSFPNAYMLLQILRLDNNAYLKAEFYSDLAEEVEVYYIDETRQEEFFHTDRSVYYQLTEGSNIYIDLDITTSNTGNKDVDTTYNFYTPENHFNLSYYQVLIVSEGEDGESRGTYITENVNLLLSEEFVYYIYSTKDVAQISFKSTLLTKVDGYVSHADLSEEYYDGLFNVIGFSYSLDGVTEETADMETGLLDGRYYAEDGRLLFEVVGNGTESATIVTTSAITSIVVQAPIYLGDSIRLIDFARTEAFEFDGDGVRASGEFVIDLSADSNEIEYVEGEVTRVSYYATYSDLVKVNIDYNLPVDSTETSHYIQLNGDTAEAVKLPSANFLVCERLSYTQPDGAEVDYTEIFTGANGTYAGIGDNKFAEINLKAYWGMGDISVSSMDATFTQSVGTLDSIYAYNTCNYGAETSELFDYLYEIVFTGQDGEKNEVVAQSSNFYNLAYSPEFGGTLEDNGTYIVRFTVSMKAEYREILSDPSNYSLTNDDVTFVVDLKPIEITGVTFVGDDEIVYDGADHIKSFTLKLAYKMFDAESLTYGEVNYADFTYGQDGKFVVGVTKNDSPVTEIKNVGEYVVGYTFDNNFYYTNGDIQSEFMVTVLPYTINLQQEDIHLTKKFNTTDTALSYAKSVNSENVTFSLSREAGEDIGTYDLYLIDFTSSSQRENYKVVFGETVLYDGSLKNLTTAVGVFEIVKSDTLRLSWSENSTISVEYNETGYSLKIEDGEIVVYNGQTSKDKRLLTAYDVLTGEEVTGNFSLIKDLLNYDNIVLNLVNSSSVETAVNSATYEVVVSVKESAKIADYYTNILFAEGYVFEIQPQIINVDGFEFKKVYDGTNKLKLKTDGTVAGEDYEGVFIDATFATYHVGENISVSLVVSATEGYVAGNYSLSFVTTRGSILKRDAILNISAKYADGKDAYTYGELSKTNLASELSVTLTDEDGTNLQDMFAISNYLINLDLEGALVNRLGYFYQGTYSVKVVDSTFGDFNILETNSDTVKISPYEMEVTLPENYITITTVDEVTTYADTQTYARTSDVLELTYIPVGLTQGAQGAIGQYDLNLMGETTFLDGSIVVTLTAENSFQIVATDEIIFLKFDNKDLLNLTYNGYDYSLSNTTEKMTITSTKVSPIDVGFSLVRKTNLGEEEYSGQITSVIISLASGFTSLKDAGSYRLAVALEAEGATNFAFYENYYITIDAISVDTSKLDLEKTYDTTNRKDEIDFAERVDDGTVNDDVSISAIYAQSAVGDDIAVTLYLNGTSAKNYKFLNDTNTAVGKIVKANAEISLAKNNYVYGEVTRDSVFNYIVTSNGKEVATTEYTVVSTIEDGEYSLNNYLVVGSAYSLTLQIESHNYNITPTTLTFNVTPFELNFTFTTNGVYRTSYGSEESLVSTFTREYNTIYGDVIDVTFTRSEGVEVGYYEILSGETLAENYIVNSVSDQSGSGAYRITPSNERFYLLISSADSITADDTACVNMTLTYDALSYNSFTFGVDKNAKTYKIVLSDTLDNREIEYTLSLYTFDGEAFTKSNAFDDSLSASLFLVGNTVAKNVGDYSVYTSNVTSTNFDVVFGKPNTLSSYVLKVLPKELEFKVSEISKEFDNTDAIFTYDDASEVLNGIITGEQVSLTLTLMDGDTVARYAGEGYEVVSTLINGGNYVVAGEITGKITKAKIGIMLADTTITYGQTPEFSYELDYGDLDLLYYDKSQISAEIEVVNGVYSSSNNLKASENGYALSVTLNSRDFEIGHYINAEGEESENLTARLYVDKRMLSVKETETPLKEIFTKLYDGTDEAEIKDISGNLLFGVQGLVEGDIVSVDSAKYAQILPASGVGVEFTISGTDADNYLFSTYYGGEITPITLNVTFDYNADGDTATPNVSAEKILDKLNYPFQATNYLSSNASGTKNLFPSLLTGRVGFTFNTWTINLTAPENTPEWTYLRGVLARLALDYIQEGDVYKVYVGNNAQTIAFLDELLSNEEGIFNLYESEESARVTFTADWIGNEYLFIVNMQDKDGNSLGLDYDDYANISINGTENLSSTVQARIAHGEKAEVKVTLQKFIGISEIKMVDDEGKEYNFDTNEPNGDTVTLTLNEVTTNLTVTLKFDYASVSVILDLSGATDVVPADERFSPYTDNSYIHSTSCENLINANLQTLPALTRGGYEVSAYIFEKFGEVSAEDFATSFILDYAYKDGEGYIVEYAPKFSELKIAVTLNYGYDNKTETIYVPFNGKFAEAEDGEGNLIWAEVETPTREGHEFLGWTDENGEAVTGESVMTNENGITLTASWKILPNQVYLKLDERLFIAYTSLHYDYLEEEDIYVFDKINYGEEFTFILRVLENVEGYGVDEIYYNSADGTKTKIGFEEKDGNATVTFKMLASPSPIYMFATSGVSQNDVLVEGENFTFKVELGGEEVTTSNNKFEADAEDVFTLTVTLEEGYVFESISSDKAIRIEEISSGETERKFEISGITSDTVITIETQKRENMVTFNFDIQDAVSRLLVNDSTIQTVAYITTGDNLVAYLSLKTGYIVSSVNFAYSEDEKEGVKFDIIEQEDSPYYGYYTFTVENITKDAVVGVAIGYETYTITAGIIAYDETGAVVKDADILSNFTAYINEKGKTTADVQYNSAVALWFENALDDYNFAGWSNDGAEIIEGSGVLENVNPYNVTVTGDVTYYAIFSKAEFNVSLRAYSYYTLGKESGAVDREEVYSQIYSTFYDGNTPITDGHISLYYGSSKTLTIRARDGYTYYGYGYIIGAEYSGSQLVKGDFEYIEYNSGASSTISLNLSTAKMLELGFGANLNNNVSFFVAFMPSSVDFAITSYIDYDGVREEDSAVANISLVGYNNGVVSEVNSYGYINGTLNHYKDSSDMPGQNFTLTTITGGEVYLRIELMRAGYSLLDIVSTRGDLVSVQHITDYNQNGRTYSIYRMFNIIGQVNEIGIDVLVAPHKNIIDINFKNEKGVVVNGGSLFVDIADEYADRIWTSGSNYSALQVVGFTDVRFKVTAYIRLGFMVDLDDISLTFANGSLTVTNVKGYLLNFEENNYLYVIYFDVSEISKDSEISINLTPQEYRVVLKDTSLENGVVATIDNVKFYETLDLSVANSANITTNLSYVNGRLDIVQTKADNVFAGYFTYDGGKGKQYINASGQTLVPFEETGYILNEETGRYQLSENAQIGVDGIITINLYLYWSYQKTQINFVITPNINANITARDLVDGINITNSWFNEDMPLYLEVAYNTDITLTAPEINGYKFYKFVIKQRDANNNELSPIVSYQNNVPWSTNERDNIVELTVEVYYFAKVNVTLSGGEMEYGISQDRSGDTEQGILFADALVKEGYVDTTRKFTLFVTQEAEDESGFEFSRWYKVSTKETFGTRQLQDEITSATNYILYVQGKTVRLDFSQYDETSGYIPSMTIKDYAGRQETVTLGYLKDGVFHKEKITYDVRVGDTVTFAVRVDYGFAVRWDKLDVSLSSITSNYLYFTLDIVGSMIDGDNNVVPINPEFIPESVAVYLNQTFDEKDLIDDATDNNDATMAGYITFNGERTEVVISKIEAGISIGIVVNARYNITKIDILNYYGETVSVDEFYSAETGKLSFTAEEIEENRLAGTIALNISYERLYHIAEEIEEQGSGKMGDPFLIYTAEDLTYYMEKINSGAVTKNGIYYSYASYRVMEDISLGEKFWTPIGTASQPFNGRFSFAGHSISNIYLATYYNPTSYGGLFGVVGSNVKIYINEENYWYIYLIIAIVILLLILLIILLIYNKRKKDKMKELSTQEMKVGELAEETKKDEETKKVERKARKTPTKEKKEKKETTKTTKQTKTAPKKKTETVAKDKKDNKK